MLLALRQPSVPVALESRLALLRHSLVSVLAALVLGLVPLVRERLALVSPLALPVLGRLALVPPLALPVLGRLALVLALQFPLACWWPLAP